MANSVLPALDLPTFKYHPDPATGSIRDGLDSSADKVEESNGRRRFGWYEINPLGCEYPSLSVAHVK